MDKSISSIIADECVNEVFKKHMKDATYGDYMSALSILLYNTSQWVADAMNEDPKAVVNAIVAGTIQLEVLH